jgi:hypothetical protein
MTAADQGGLFEPKCFAQKVLHLYQNRRVATDPILKPRYRLTILRLNLWPVATAAGSDRTRLVFIDFLRKGEPKKLQRLESAV